MPFTLEYLGPKTLVLGSLDPSGIVYIYEKVMRKAPLQVMVPATATVSSLEMCTSGLVLGFRTWSFKIGT